MEILILILLIVYFIGMIILFLLLENAHKRIDNIVYCLSRLEQRFNKKNNN